jgi:hypothetical protein
MYPIRLVILVLAAALVVCAASCVPRALQSPDTRYEDVGSFGTGGFFHEELPYRVVYLPQTDDLMGADWIVDNFYQKDGRWRPKETAEYRDELRFDTDGDGKTDVNLKLPSYDLRFLHKRRSSEIWLSSVPLSSEYAQTDLRVLAKRYVDAAAGGYATIRLFSAGEKRYSTRMVGSVETSVAGHPALEFTFEVANVDQLELSKTSRLRLVRIVLVRPGFAMRVDDSDYRVLTIFGHSAMPDDFDHTLSDFASLINRFGPYQDGALDTATDRVLACLEPEGGDSLQLQLEIDGAGNVEDAMVEPEEQLGKPTPAHLVDMSDAARKRDEELRDRRRDVRACAREALADVAVPGSGSEREVLWTFRRGELRAPKEHPPYTTEPHAANTQPVSAPAAPAAASPAATPAVAPASAATPEDGLRAKIDAHRADVLACAGTERLPVELSYAGGAVEVKLTGELAGSAEEGCVRQVLGALPAPPGEGRLIHLVR